MGLGRDGTLHGTYESRSCPFPLGRPVSRKAGKTKKQNINYSGIPKFMRKPSMLTVKTENNAKYLKFYGRNIKSTRSNKFGDYPAEMSDSNLETGRYSPKCGVSRIIQES